MPCMSLSMGSFLVRLIVLFDFINMLRVDFIATGSAHGTRQNKRFTYSGEVNLRAGSNRIALLSVAMGLPVRSLNAFLSLYL